MKTPLMHQLLVGDAQRLELATGAFGLGERGGLGAGDEDERRLRAGSASAARVCLVEHRCCSRPASGPRHEVPVVLPAMNLSRRGQAEQPQRVAGRGGVEDDVVEAVGCRRVAEQPRELVEGGDLEGAGPRELLLDARDRGLGQHAR